MWFRRLTHIVLDTAEHSFLGETSGVKTKTAFNLQSRLSAKVFYLAGPVSKFTIKAENN